LCKSLPEGLGYGDIYYKMYEEWNERKEKPELITYGFNSNMNDIFYEF
jgi:hypothetical protein